MPTGRSSRAQLARQTLEILERGEYRSSGGAQVAVRAMLDACVRGTRLHEPAELLELVRRRSASGGGDAPARIEVLNQTTLEGIARLVGDGGSPVAALNFASARNPGGGFLGGSQAQEESLARSSGLYPSLMRAWSYYERHRAMKSCLYSDAMILTPDCPVIRDDSGQLLAQVQVVTFITSAAPNAGAVAANEPGNVARLPGVLRQRAECVLALAAAAGRRNLVLGAWGCGVFRNDPSMVAATFAQLLGEGGWSRSFDRVLFSVRDSSQAQEVYRTFAAALERSGT